MTSSRQKIALVTGASRGIGAAIARRLADDGFAVVLNHANSPREADELVLAMNAREQTAMAVQADVASGSQVKAMFDEVEHTLGTIDVLVNNAGILRTTPLAQTSDADYDRHFDVNAKGTFNTMREAATRLNEGDRKSVV